MAIASKRTDLDVCAFHNYHVMTELSCGVLNSPCTLAYLCLNLCRVSLVRQLYMLPVDMEMWM